MRQVRFVRAALACGAIALLGLSGTSFGQSLVNPNFNQYTATTDPNGNGEDYPTGWNATPIPNYVDAAGTLNYTNYANVEPWFDGTNYTLWLQTFCNYGNVSQTVTGAVAGNTYTASADFAVQDGTGPGMGYNATTLANQPNTTGYMNTGDLYSYIGLVFLNKFNSPIGTLDSDNLSNETTIPAGSVAVYNQANGFTPWLPYSVSGVAPAGTASVEVVIGWNNGGADGNTGSQSALVTGVSLVPEPASFGLLALGGLATLRRRSR